MSRAQIILNYGYFSLFNFHLQFHRRSFKSIKMEFSFCNLRSLYRNSGNYAFHWMGVSSSQYIPLQGILSIPSYLYPKILLTMTIIQVAVTELGPPSFWSQHTPGAGFIPKLPFLWAKGNQEWACQVPLHSSFCGLQDWCRQSHLPNTSLSRSQTRKHNFIPMSSFLCPNGEGTEEECRHWDVCEA